MALIKRTKKSRPAPRRIEQKKAPKKAEVKKNLRRKTRTQKKNSRFFGEIWQKLRGPLGWGFGIGLGLFIFFLCGVGLLYAYNFFTTNQYFAVKTIEIQGQNRLKSREVLETAGLDYGQNTLALSMNELESSLAQNPWIAELSIRRVLPDSIKINIREYEPRYWVQRGGVLTYADEYGAPIAPVYSGNFVSLPLLEVDSGAEYLAGRLPELMGKLEKLSFPIKLRAAGSIRLTASRSLEVNLENGLRLIVGLDGWTGNLDNLVRVLEDLTRRGELKNAVEIKAHGRGVWVGTKRKRT